MMTLIPPGKLIVATLVTVICGCSTHKSDTTSGKETIVSGDPRFSVFELSNSNGDGTFSNPQGTVYLSFAARDLRYCRAARFHNDNTAILACRNELGWQIEATSESAPYNKDGNVAQAINDAIFQLNPRAEFLDEREIIETASRGWQ